MFITRKFYTYRTHNYIILCNSVTKKLNNKGSITIIINNKSLECKNQILFYKYYSDKAMHQKYIQGKKHVFHELCVVMFIVCLTLFV